MPIVIDDAWYDRIDASLPPFPEVKKQQLMDEGLTEYDADLLVGSRVLCDCFDEAYRVSGLAKECANWIGTNCLALLKKSGQTVDDLELSGTRLGELVKLVGDGVVSNANAKIILEVMFEGDDVDPQAYAEAHDMVISNDADAVMDVIRAIVAENEKDANDYRGGKREGHQPAVRQVHEAAEGQLRAQAAARDADQVPDGRLTSRLSRG